MMETNRHAVMMKEKAQAVQTIVGEVSGLDEAFQYVIDLTKRQGGETIAAPGLEAPHRLALEKLCEEHSVRLLTERLRDYMSEIHTALTLADWGIADTATVVLDSSAEDMRIATMLSETHAAVLPRSRIRPDAMTLEEELARLMSSAPRYLAFISGASRTADIERVLTIGVHGPQELHILILEDEQR